MGMHNNPRIIKDGLVLHFDAGDTNSYPGSGATWYNLSNSSNNITLSNITFATGSLNTTQSAAAMDLDSSVTFSTSSGEFSHTFVLWANILVGDSAGWNYFCRTTFGSSVLEIGTYATSIYFRMKDNISPTTEAGTNTSGINMLAFGISYYNGGWKIFMSLNGGTKSWSNNILGFSATYQKFFNLTTSNNLHSECSMFSLYNRELTEEELAQIYNSYKSRFGWV